MIRFWIVLLLVLGSGLLLGQNVNATAFETATEAYASKDFESAISAYETLLKAGYKHPDLNYNLGNAYYKIGKMGKAILHYERALRLKPNHKDAQHNLQVVQTQLEHETIRIAPFFPIQWWQNTYSLFSSNTWAIITLVWVWLALVGGAFWLLGRNRKYKKLGFVTGSIFLFFAIITYLLAKSNLTATATTSEAIVVIPTASLRLAADEASTELMSIKEGTSVEILDNIGTWYKVTLSDNTVGWIMLDAIEVI